MAQTQPPKAEIRNVTDDYFGRKIVDPYRWMENEKDPEFVSFLKAQADYARATRSRYADYRHSDSYAFAVRHSSHQARRRD